MNDSRPYPLSAEQQSDRIDARDGCEHRPAEFSYDSPAYAWHARCSICGEGLDSPNVRAKPGATVLRCDSA